MFPLVTTCDECENQTDVNSQYRQRIPHGQQVYIEIDLIGAKFAVELLVDAISW